MNRQVHMCTIYTLIILNNSFISLVVANHLDHFGLSDFLRLCTNIMCIVKFQLFLDKAEDQHKIKTWQDRTMINQFTLFNLFTIVFYSITNDAVTNPRGTFLCCVHAWCSPPSLPLIESNHPCHGKHWVRYVTTYWDNQFCQHNSTFYPLTYPPFINVVTST